MNPPSNTSAGDAASTPNLQGVDDPALYRNIVETVTDAIVTVDERRAIVLFNPQAERSFGYSADEVIGQPLELLIPEAVREAHVAHVASFSSDKTTRRRMGEATAVLARRKNGDVFPAEVTISKFEEKGAQLFTAVVRDVTARQQADAAFQESAERFRVHFKNSPLQIFAFQREGGDFRLVECNDEALKATGGQVTRLLESRMSELWADRPDLIDMAWRCFRERTVIQTEVEYQYRSTGKLAWLAISLGFVPPNFVMMSADDITSRVEKEHQIARLTQEMEQRVLERTRELQTSQERLADAERLAKLGHIEYDVASDRVLMSEQLFEIAGMSSRDFDGRPAGFMQFVHPDDRALFASAPRNALERDGSYDIEFRIRRPDGGGRTVQLRARATRSLSGQDVRFFGTVQDVTERRLADLETLHREELLQRTRKLEAVGLLAGGVAHDFNNLLTVIQGRAEILQARLDPQDPGHADTQVILNVAERGAKLTDELLAFGRKQVTWPRPLDLRELLEKTTHLLVRICGQDIQMAVEAQPHVNSVWADSGQIERAICNLVKNASDSMPEGGRITVETGNVAVSDDLAQRLNAPPGAYVKLAVRDYGVGMDSELQKHIFEPFYSDESIRSGNGLRMSAVYGIVRQSGGYIDVQSAPGQGTCFSIYLPALAAWPMAQTRPVEVAAPADSVRANNWTILLAEDEDEVREMVREFLESQGYRVLSGPDGRTALRIASEHADPIDLLISDVVMPFMAGPELAEHMQRERPDLKILFMSGHVGEFALPTGVFGPNAPLLRKPFSLETLARIVRERLAT
jgi:PAS domain S-box-containing protein